MVQIGVVTLKYVLLSIILARAHHHRHRRRRRHRVLGGSVTQSSSIDHKIFCLRDLGDLEEVPLSGNTNSGSAPSL